jgi:hypothetical protein
VLHAEALESLASIEEVPKLESNYETRGVPRGLATADCRPSLRRTESFPSTRRLRLGCRAPFWQR